MNTQTHLLLAAALLCRPNAPKRNAAVIAGALAPDLGVFGLWIWSKLAGVVESEVWRTIYFAEPMQTIQAVANSVPLYLLLLIAASAAIRRVAHFAGRGDAGPAGHRAASAATSGGTRSAHTLTDDRLSDSIVPRPGRSLAERWTASIDAAPMLALFALAALTHLAGDLPVHADDAHRHFWPLSDWRFHSPVSYWNPSQGGGWFAFVEATIGIAAAVVLFRRFGATWVRALLGLAIAAYVVVPLYFTLALGG